MWTHVDLSPHRVRAARPHRGAGAERAPLGAGGMGGGDITPLWTEPEPGGSGHPAAGGRGERGGITPLR